MKWLAGIGVGLVIAVLTFYIGISEPVFDFIYGNFFVPEPVPALICIFSLAIIAGIAGFVL